MKPDWVMVLLTLVYVVLTGIYVSIGIKAFGVLRQQGEIAERAANAAERANAVAQDTLVIGQRPWVSADVSIAQPLVFDERGAVMGLKITLKNVGHSVAKYASVWTALKLGPPDPVEQEKLCGIPKAPVNANSDYGYLLFPDQHIDEFQPVIAQPKEIEQALKGPYAIQGMVTFYVLVCVDYKSSFEPSHHQTRLVRLLVRPDPKTGFAMGAFDTRGVYNQLTLVPQLHGDSAD